MRAIWRREPLFPLGVAHPAVAIADAIGCDTDPPPQLRLSAQCNVVIFASWRGRPGIAHYGTCNPGLAVIRRQARGLRLAAADPAIALLAPRTMEVAGAAGAGMLVETRVAGRPPAFAWSKLEEIAEAWLSRRTAHSGPARGDLEQEVHEAYTFFPEYAELLRPLGDALLAWLSPLGARAETGHGDLWLNNVLFENGRISGIVDWEWCRADGLLATDILHLYFMSYAVHKEVHVANLLRQFWSGELEERQLRLGLQALSARTGLDLQDLKYAALLLWFDYIWQRAVRGLTPPPAWTENLIPRTAPAIRGWLGQTARRVPR